MDKPRRSRRVTWIELAVLLGFIVILAAIALPNVNPAHEAQLRASCQANLKSLGTAFSVYANEDARGFYPRIHGYEVFGDAANAPGCLHVDDAFDFGPDTRVLYPDYVQDPLLFVCPAGPHGKRPRRIIGSLWIGGIGYRSDAVAAAGLVSEATQGSCEYAGTITNGDISYVYFPWALQTDGCGFEDAPEITDEMAEAHGYAMTGPAQIVAAAQWIRAAMEADPQTSAVLLDSEIDLAQFYAPLGAPYTTAGAIHDSILFRLRLHIDRVMLRTLPSSYFRELPSLATIPVMLDRFDMSLRTFAHIPGGSNVLFMDGHVEFVRYPERFPVSETALSFMRTLQVPEPESTQ